MVASLNVEVKSVPLKNSYIGRVVLNVMHVKLFNGSSALGWLQNSRCSTDDKMSIVNVIQLQVEY